VSLGLHSKISDGPMRLSPPVFDKGILIPIVDVANHASTQISNAHRPFGGAFSLLLKRPTAKDQEIVHAYRSDYNNSALFVNYGFVDSRNPVKMEHFLGKRECDEFLAHRLMNSKALASSSSPTVLANLQALLREACSPHTINETAITVSSE